MESFLFIRLRESRTKQIDRKKDFQQGGTFRSCRPVVFCIPFLRRLFFVLGDGGGVVLNVDDDSVLLHDVCSPFNLFFCFSQVLCSLFFMALLYDSYFLPLAHNRTMCYNKKEKAVLILDCLEVKFPVILGKGIICTAKILVVAQKLDAKSLILTRKMMILLKRFHFYRI